VSFIFSIVFILPNYNSFLACSSCLMRKSYLNFDRYKGQSLTDKIMRMWIHRREKVVHNYSHVGYMLSPIPAIIKHCAANRTASLSDASEHLIDKLILDRGLIGSQHSRELAFLIDKFKDEYGDFTNKQGKFNKANIWIMASDEKKGYHWHQKYSLDCTDVLGKLACLVLSKILGIGSAEMNWKQVKKIKRGDRVQTGIDKTAK
jgi:hypothetical protein